MRRVPVTFLTAVWLIWMGCAHQQPRRTTAAFENIPAEVAAEFQQSVAAWNGGNLNAFMSIYADHVTLATPDGFLQGRRAVRDFYAPNFAPGEIRVHLTMEQLEVEVLGPDVVLVRAIYQNTLKGQVTRRGPSTLVLRRMLGQWQIIHDHSS